jgi:hypothetical protein
MLIVPTWYVPYRLHAHVLYPSYTYIYGHTSQHFDGIHLFHRNYPSSLYNCTAFGLSLCQLRGYSLSLSLSPSPSLVSLLTDCACRCLCGKTQNTDNEEKKHCRTLPTFTDTATKQIQLGAWISQASAHSYAFRTPLAQLLTRITRCV